MRCGVRLCCLVWSMAGVTLMPTVSNDYLDLRNAKSTRIRSAFQSAQIGEATYRASLSILGLRGEDIDNEVRSAREEKANNV